MPHGRHSLTTPPREKTLFVCKLIRLACVAPAPEQGSPFMTSRRHLLHLALAGAFAAVAAPASAQQTIKIGELNSYKAPPAFLDPYKKGWELAVEEINAAGGVLGKKIEVVSRDDG